MDPLDSRVAELERRLESLEKPAKKPAKKPAPRTARPKAAATPQAGTVALARPDDAAKDDAPAGGENEPTG